jgi:hypothetical protein
MLYIFGHTRVCLATVEHSQFCSFVVIFYFRIIQQRRRPEHTHTYPYEHMYANPTQWAPPKDWASISRDSWSHHRGTSPITESIAPLNPGINPGKCKHPCQVEDLNLGGQVPPWNPTSWSMISLLLCGHLLISMYCFVFLPSDKSLALIQPWVPSIHDTLQSIQFSCIPTM